MKKNMIGAIALCATLAVGPAFGQALDPKLAIYKPVSGVSGSLKSIGSDTLNNLMTLWTEGFRMVPVQDR